MKSKLKNNWLLILIVLVSAFLRLYNLNLYPALNADEAAIGYNAYSLIQTGKDEHGHSWPIHFQSFNDWKPGGYFYLVLPFVKILGLNEWAVRLPNALFGILSSVVIYYLVKTLFGDLKSNIFNFNVSAGHLAALFLAISPWHIHFSRGGWEVNTATFFIICGTLFLIKGLTSNFNVKKIAISAVFFALSIYTYHAARVVSPLLVLGILLIYYKNTFIYTNLKKIILLLFLSAILFSPLIKDLLTGDVLSRAAGVGLFADRGPINRINEQRGEHPSVDNIFGKLSHNKPVNYLLTFAKNWASHFQGEFLFLTGDSIQRNKVPETGQMLLVDILFLVFGFVWMSRNFNRDAIVVAWWLLISPVAAALTFQAPHALRAEIMVIPLVIISAVGLTYILESLSTFKYKTITMSVIVLLMVWCVGRYVHQYNFHMSKEYPYSSQYGIKELVSYISEKGNEYNSVVITDRYDQPYILFLFYLEYPPQHFQVDHSISSRDEYGFSTVRSFDKYHFESIDFQQTKQVYPTSLIVGTPLEIPKESNIIKKIYGTNGYEYFDIVAN